MSQSIAAPLDWNFSFSRRSFLVIPKALICSVSIIVWSSGLDIKPIKIPAAIKPSILDSSFFRYAELRSLVP